MIKNKRIFCAGGAGSIGSELVRQLAVKNKIFILDQEETNTFNLTEELKQDGYWVYCRIGDILNKDTVHDVFSDFKPQLVFNAAARKHVTPNEIYPEEAIQINIIGTLNLIQEAKKYECFEKFIQISTDKVVNTTSIMGASKKVAEIIVRNQGGVVVRFGNVMGSRGSVIPLWQNQIDRDKPITITDVRMERYFMTISQACELVIEAAEQGKGGEIWIMDMKQRIKVLDLAKAIVEHSGGGTEIKEIGIRPGETLLEEIMTVEEKRIAIKKGNFWVIYDTNSMY